jgi:hypothetical protein
VRFARQLSPSPANNMDGVTAAPLHDADGEAADLSLTRRPRGGVD